MASSPDPLAEYRAKRDASRTPEPEGRFERQSGSVGLPRFVVHKHAARRLHWDLRLEVNGVLWSWAVPNGPSRDPAEKRLAVHTEDHPLEYADFEDVIPEGNYGAGAMIAWDTGTYMPLEPMEEGLVKGKLLFELRGHKLRGAWTLVKLRKAEEDAWLLIKERDAMAAAGADAFPEDSVFSGLTVEQLGSGEDPAEPIQRELAHLKAPTRTLDPRDVKLMLAESASEPFSRSGWVFEFKYDGYRALIFREDDDIRLLSRRGNDLSKAFPDLVEAIRRLPYRRFLLDGEIVVEDDAGLPSFQRLQQRAQLRRALDIRRGMATLPARMWIFDLIGFEDRDVRGLPLTTRKSLLRRLLPSAGTLRYSDHIEEHGEALFSQAVRLGMEGVIGKKASSPYRSFRSSDWIKVRSLRSEDFVVVGWTAPKGGRAGFGALHLAQYVDGELRYMGQVGSGFTDRQLRDLHARLSAARIDSPACAGAPTGKDHSWTHPELVCEVRYLERTDDGLLRQPVFLRMRDDKSPEECVAIGIEGAIDLEESTAGLAADRLEGVLGERVIDEPLEEGAEPPPAVATELPDDADAAISPAGAGKPLKRSRRKPATAAAPSDTAAEAPVSQPTSADRAVKFTNLDKVYWPEDGYTKGDLIAYYHTISPWMLPYLRDRPIVLTRYPDGIHGKSFFQKDAPGFAPKWLRIVPVPGDEGERTLSYFSCDNEETLLYLANSGSIPLHIWSSRFSNLERPDWCILDLDPKEAPFEHVIEVARAAKELCDDIGLPLYVKTSGSSGIHLLVPLGGLLDHEGSKALGELLARVLIRQVGQIATITRQVERRGGKVYIDYLQNGRGKLLVAPYSVRPLPGAPVSMPLEWSEVAPGLNIRQFTIRSAPRRVEKWKADPLAPVLGEAPDLLSALAALQARLG